MFNKPSSSVSSHHAHLTSPKIAQVSGKEKSSQKVLTDINEDADKREIENNKDFINTSQIPPSAEKIKQKPGRKPLKNEKPKNPEPPPKVEEASSEKPKKERNYDVKATRHFIKQKRNERQQQAQVAKEEKSKNKDRSEIKLKLQELRSKQLNILKNSAKRRKDEQPEWIGLGSGDGVSKLDTSELVLITAPEKSIKKDVPISKPKRFEGLNVKKAKNVPTAEPMHPNSFYDDVNFPMEFINEETNKMKQTTYNSGGKNELYKTKQGYAPQAPKVVKTVSDAQMIKNQSKLNTSDSQALKCKRGVSDSQVGKTDQVNMILQEEIKQGLEATNEFMNQVSQQMKLLTEHFKLVGDSKANDPGGPSKSVQAKDSAVQAFSSSLSDLLEPDKNQEIKKDNKTSDGWKDISYCLNENVDTSKMYSSQAQKTSLINELFSALDNLSSNPQNPELSARRKLDFIQQSSAQEVHAFLEREILERGLSAQLLSSPRTQVQKIPHEFPTESEDIKFTSTYLSPSKKASSKYLKSDRSLLSQEANEEKIFHTLDKISGGKSDTTISESLSTDPLKLPDNVENLALNIESHSIPNIEQSEVIANNDSIVSSNLVESSKLQFNDIKLDTNSIEGLQIRTPPLLEKKKSNSNVALSQSLSEISEKVSNIASPGSSKSYSQISFKRSNQSSQLLREVSEKCSKSNYSNHLSKHDSFNDLKSIKESLEASLNMHKNNSNSADNPLTLKSENRSDINSIKTESSKRSRSDKHSGNIVTSENKYKFDQDHPLSESNLAKSKKYSSFEDLAFVKSGEIEAVSSKSFSEKKLKTSSQSLHSNLSDVSNSGSERLKDRSTGRINIHSDTEQNVKKTIENSFRLRRQSGQFFHLEPSVTQELTDNFSDKHGIKKSTPKLKKPEKCISLPGTSSQNQEVNFTSHSKKSDLAAENSDSSGFTLLQPYANVNFVQRNAKSKRRSSSEKNLQKLFYEGVSFTSVSSNPAQMGSLSFHDQILKEMENLDAVNTNLSHALARNQALSTENLANLSNISTSASVGGHGVCDVPNFPLHLSLSDTTNNQSFGSSVMDAKRDLNLGLDNLEDPSLNLSKFSLRLLENLLVDEELRYQNQASILEMRKQAILDKTKAELTLLSVERVKQKARGNEEMLRSIKKKERGIVMKCYQDFDEIKRLQKVGKEASRDRILLIKNQIHLLKSHMSTNKYAQKLLNTSGGKSGRKSGLSPSKNEKQSSKSISQYVTRANLESQKRELERRVAVLAAKRQSFEAVMTWTKKVEDEEKRLKDMEKLITISSHTRQALKQGVDRGTSPLNLVCDSELAGNKAAESSASSSEQQIDSKLNRKAVTDKSTDNYSDTFDQASSSEHAPQIKVIDNTGNDKAGKRKSVVAIKIPLSPRIPPTKRRHSSGSDESILFSQNETSETSDIEVRVSTLQQQLKQRKSELELLKKQHSKSQREKLRATEQALISQINAYDGYIKQLKNEMQELDNGTVKVMKPQIKQPKFSERRKSELFTTTEKKKDSEQKDTFTSEEVELSESTESVKTLVESPRIRDDHIRSSTEDSIRTENDIQVSEEIKTDSVEPEISDITETESKILLTESILKNTAESLSPEVLKTNTDVISDEMLVSTDKEISEEITDKDLDEIISYNVQEESIMILNNRKVSHSEPNVSEIIEPPTNVQLDLKEMELASELQEVSSEINTANIDINPSLNNIANVNELLKEQNLEEFENEKLSEIASKVSSEVNYEIEKEPSKSEISSKVLSGAIDEVDRESIQSEISSKVLSGAIDEVDRESIKSEISSKVLSGAIDEVDRESIKSEISSKVISDAIDEMERESVKSEVSSKVLSDICHKINNESVKLEISSNVLLEANDEIEMELVKSEVLSDEVDEIEKEFVKSEVSTISSSEEVKTESIIRSLESSENNELLIINVDIKEKEKEIIPYFENEVVENIESILPEDDLKDDVEASLVTDLSNLEHMYSNEGSKLFDSELSPISSSLHSGENIQLMSAALMRAIEETKENTLKEEIESSIEDYVKSILSKEEESGESSKTLRIPEDHKDLSTSKELELKLVTKYENIPEEIIEGHSPIPEHILNTHSPCNETFIVNKDDSFDDNELLGEEDAEDLMLRMISESFTDSERLWNLDVEDCRKIREETPFLTALQRENDLSNTINAVSQQLFRNLYENGVSDVLRVYSIKKESVMRDEILDEYHVPDFDYCKEDSKEIEELEAAGMRAFYLREIPNKPPPPYTPPRPVKSRPTRQIVSRAVELGISTLWECDHLETLDSLEPPSSFLTDMMQHPDNMYREMMWDLCLELYRKAKPITPPPMPPWLIQSKRKKLAPPPRSKECMIKWCTNQAFIIFGYEPAVKKENMIIRWSHKKRDRVDEILIRESQEEETDWVDYSAEENLIKNRIANSIIDDIVEDATKAILSAFLNKLSS